MKTLVTSFFLLTLIAGMLHTQVIHVPGDQPSIQAGIDSAANGDTVLVADSTYYENIDFKGKAITVASHFIIDGDTSHISKTIIDGSKPEVASKSTVVIMQSGEDTTSVLMGFTITGGKGNLIQYSWATDLCGGGIVIDKSGGKIINNIIMGNSLSGGNQYKWGGGIYANVHNNHTAIIRNNIIKSNSITSGWIGGGGIFLIGGRIIVEHNSIIDNSFNGSSSWSSGAGIYWADYGLPETINEVIIRNNIISGNEGYCPNPAGGAGGFGTGMGNFKVMQIYNNVICNNYITGNGGGIYSYRTPILIYNNTIYNNVSTTGGNSISFGNGNCVMYNNIIWSDADNDLPDINFWEGNINSLLVFNNILKKPFGYNPKITAGNNTYLEPVFKADSYELSDNSPAIGRGVDSVQSKDVWYHTPVKDMAGNVRPNAIDVYVDLGAYESEFSRPVLSSADLVNIILGGFVLNPEFQCDTLEYCLMVRADFDAFSDLQAIPADMLSNAEIDHATDLVSDSVTTITVTSSDGSTEKVYKVIFRLDATGLKESFTDILKFYPNPFSTVARLELSENSKVHKIELLTILGETVRTINDIQGNSVRIDRGDLASGLYLLKVYARKTYVIKVLIE